MLGIVPRGISDARFRRQRLGLRAIRDESSSQQKHLMAPGCLRRASRRSKGICDGLAQPTISNCHAHGDVSMLRFEAAHGVRRTDPSGTHYPPALSHGFD
jgi:hypothetical protein